MRNHLNVTTKIYQTKPGREDTVLLEIWQNYFNLDSLRSVSFNYKLGTSKDDLPPAAVINASPTSWEGIQSYYNGYYPYYMVEQEWMGSKLLFLDRAEKTEDIYTDWVNLTSGVNRQLPNLYLNLSYIVPGYECWRSFILNSHHCDHKNISGTSSNDLKDITVLDIFPATIGEFQRMLWLNSYDWLGYQKDHDNDGLLGRNDAGLGQIGPDGNDNDPDFDGDGVPDAREREAGTAWNIFDTDQDGLGDGLELVLGTNPLMRDSDDDGLTDKQEVDGTLFEYDTGKFTLVTSDPTLVDTDADGLYDQAELLVKTNPRAYTRDTLALQLFVDDTDGFVLSGQTLAFTTTLGNNGIISADLLAKGRVNTTFPAALGGGVSDTPVLLALGQVRTKTITNPLTVTCCQASGPITVSSTLSATLVSLLSNPPSTQGTVNTASSKILTVDNDNPAATLFNPTFVAPGVTYILGGEASDPTSYVTRVEIRIGAGAWQDTTVPVLTGGNGISVWSYDWGTSSTEGVFAVTLRVTDVVGHVQEMPAETISVDAKPPFLTTSLNGNPIVAIERNQDQRWTIPIDGTAFEPGLATSGAVAVEVSLEPHGTGWQPAQLVTTTVPNTWVLDYPLYTFDTNNAVIADPSGQYTFTVRARDAIGNITSDANMLSARIRVDNTPPIVSLNDLSAVKLITGTETIMLSGVVSETGVISSGIASVDVGFTPEILTNIYADTLFVLSLDDGPGAVTFRDSSGKNHHATCTPPECPTTGVPGNFGTAANFNNSLSQSLQIGSTALPATNYSFVGWFKTFCLNCGIFAAYTSITPTVQVDRQIYLSGGNVCADVFNGGREAICSADANYADGQWHMAAQVLGAGGDKLYVDGQLAASGIKSSSGYGLANTAVLGHAPQASTPYFNGQIDEVKLFPLTLSARSSRRIIPLVEPLGFGCYW